jgi:hypothetical protein
MWTGKLASLLPGNQQPLWALAFHLAYHLAEEARIPLFTDPEVSNVNQFSFLI